MGSALANLPRRNSDGISWSECNLQGRESSPLECSESALESREKQPTVAGMMIARTKKPVKTYARAYDLLHTRTGKGKSFMPSSNPRYGSNDSQGRTLL